MVNNLQYLDFEKEVAELDKEIGALTTSKETPEKLAELKKTRSKTLKRIEQELDVWQVVSMARHPNRPHSVDIIDSVFKEFDELRGDRNSHDDKAVICGLARLDKQAVVVIAQEKGREVEEKAERNFGMMQPEGYRKAKRIMQLAERFGLPIISFIDTPGAYPGIQGEEKNQAEAIAENLFYMARLKVPILSIVIGEGGSGGALAIGVSDYLAMMKYSIYSVASPEACASILWRDAKKANLASQAMKIRSDNLKQLKLIDEVLAEPLGGAHRDYKKTCKTIKTALMTNVAKLSQLSIDQLVEQRYHKIMALGT